MTKYKFVIVFVILTIILAACGGDGAGSTASGSSNPGWGGAGGSGSVDGSSSTIKPFGSGNGVWPGGQTDGTNSSIQSPDWGNAPRETPAPRSDNPLAPLLNPEGQGLQPTPIPPPPPTPIPPPIQPVQQQTQGTSPDGSPLPQASDSCVCYSTYAAQHGHDWPYRRCNDPWPGDQSICLPPGGNNWAKR